MPRVATLLFVGLVMLAPVGAAAGQQQRFDLVCEIRGNRISSQAGKPQYWNDELKVVVDLSTMRYCEQPDCARSGPQKIAARRGGRLFFYDQPNLKWSVGLEDGKSQETMTDGKRRSLIAGTCRKTPFTGFSWRVADDSPAAFREPAARAGTHGSRPHHGARAVRHR